MKTTNNADLAKSIGNTTGSYDMAEHIGLVVYNVNKCDADISSGLHVWDGTTWVALDITNNGTLAPGVYEVIDSRDGEIYLARNFGAAGDWMLENIRYDPLIYTDTNFTGYIHAFSSAFDPYNDKYYAYSEGPMDYYPADHPSSEWEKKKKNGMVYNWAAATNGGNASLENQGHGEPAEGPATSIRGICPANWHLPSDKEWNQLEAVFAAGATKYTNTYARPFTWEDIYNTTIDWRPNKAKVFGHGKSMKSACPPFGSSTDTGGDSKTAKNGGFNILLSGIGTPGIAYHYGEYGYMWSSSSFTSATPKDSFAWYRSVGFDKAGVIRRTNDRSWLLSVRCKKD